MLLTYDPKNKKRRTRKLKKRKREIRKDRLVRQQRVFLRTPNSKGFFMQRKKARRILSLGSLTLILVGVILMVSLPIFVVQTVQVSDQDTYLSTTVESKTWELINDSWLGFISKSNIWLVNRSYLKENLMSDLPGIEDIHIEKHLPNNLRLKITSRKPSFVWSTAGKYYYGDHQGMIFTEVLRSEITDVTLPFIHNTFNRTIETREHALTTETIKYVEEISSQLSERFDFVITMYTIPSALAPEIEIHISEGWSIKLNPTQSQEQQLNTLTKLLSDEIGAKRSSLLYIDLRTLDLVTYRYK